MEYISPTSQSQNVNPGLINQQLIHRGGANVNLVLHHFITLMGLWVHQNQQGHIQVIGVECMPFLSGSARRKSMKKHCRVSVSSV